MIASIEERIVSPSLVLQRLGSYARQNSVYQALSEIGRVQKTVHILKTLDDEDYRRRMGRELNKGEASHDLSRFLCFGKEGVLRGREFGDQVHTFSCLSVLHNAVVAWNMIHIGEIVGQLRADGHDIDDETLSHVTPCFANTSIRLDGIISIWTAFKNRWQDQPRVLNGGFRLDVATTPS